MLKVAGGQHWNQVHGRVPAPESLYPNNSFTNDTEENHISKSRILRHVSAQFPDINLLENIALVVDEFLHPTGDYGRLEGYVGNTGFIVFAGNIPKDSLQIDSI